MAVNVVPASPILPVAPRGGAVLAAASVWGTVFFDRFAPIYLTDRIAQELGAPTSAEGLLPLLIGLGFAGSSLLGIFLIERIATHRIHFAAVTIAASAVSLASVASASWFTFSALRGVSGLIAGAAAPAITGVVYHSVPARQRGRDLGIVQSSTRLFGSLLCPVVIAVAAAAAGWRAGLIASSLGVALAGLFCLVAAPPDTGGNERRPRSGESRIPKAAYFPIAVSAVVAASVLGWLVTFSQGALRLLQQWLDVGLERAGALTAVFGIGAFLAAISLPAASDRFGRARTLLAATLVGATGGLTVALLAEAAMGGPILAVALLLVAGLAMGSMPLVISVIPAEAVEGGPIARALMVPIITAEVVGGALIPAGASLVTGATGSVAWSVGVVAAGLALVGGGASAILLIRE